MSIWQIRRLLSPRRRIRRFLDLDFEGRGTTYERLIGRFQSAPPLEIEIDVSDAQLSALFERTAETWRMLGESRPHWSVKTDEALSNDLAAFDASGRDDVALFLATLKRAGVAESEIDSALDFGCGVGRITKYLAETFNEAVGVDVSEPHLAIARQAAPRSRLIHISSVTDIADLPNADLVYSYIVLQHNSPPVMSAILERLLGLTKKYIYFQIPTYLPGYRFRVNAYLEQNTDGRQKRGDMEMHVLPQQHIFALLARNGFVPLEVQEDRATGTPDVQSHTFLAARAA